MAIKKHFLVPVKPGYDGAVPIARMPSGPLPSPTRELLMETAEGLFAERGIHGVSLREIGLAAGQRNNGATQYHFGDKDSLVVAIFERRAAEVNARRLALLDEALAAGRDGVRDLLSAFVIPLAEQVTRGRSYVRFLSRLQADGHRDVLRSAGAEVSSAYERIGRLLRRRHLQSLPRDLFWNRWTLTINTALNALADYQARGTGLPGDHHLSLELFTAELVDALAGMLTAPSTGVGSRGRSPSR
jgi:AcrR family transcriptional regulator